MIQVSDLQLPAVDGFPLAGTLFGPPPGTTIATVLINPATAVKRGYYGRYATFLADRRLRVVTFDYRGVGDSRPERLRGFDAKMRDWAELDTSGVIEWITDRFPSERLLLVGHSFGGQALGLLPNARRVEAALFVAVQSGYWGHWKGRRRLGMLLFWYALIPVLTPLFGYFPARRLGFAEDFPAGVAREWASWGRRPRYLLGAGVEAWRRRYAELELPILAYSFSDDRYAPKAAVEALLKSYRRARVEHRHLTPTHYSVPEIGHFGFFQEALRFSLWDESARWLTARGQRPDPNDLTAG